MSAVVLRGRVGKDQTCRRVVPGLVDGPGHRDPAGARLPRVLNVASYSSVEWVCVVVRNVFAVLLGSAGRLPS